MILVNGKALTMVSAQDRGLLYGDGLFETIAVIDRQPRLMDLHWQRLRQGCRRLNIPVPERKILDGDIQHLLFHSDYSKNARSVIKVIMTRGAGGRGYRYQPDTLATRIVMISDWPAHYETMAADGVHCKLCSTRLSTQPLLAGIKHLNRLEQVMARAEWSDDRIDEGIMLDQNGLLIEGTMSNIFLVNQQGQLVTPSLEHCGIAGVQRENILTLAADQHMDCRISDLSVSELPRYKEVFLTNSLIGIWPVLSIDHYEFTIGPVTRGLQQYLANNDQATTGNDEATI
jgi:4-amino-4-deoxychorismate lyase